MIKNVLKSPTRGLIGFWRFGSNPGLKSQKSRVLGPKALKPPVCVCKTSGSQLKTSCSGRKVKSTNRPILRYLSNSNQYL